MASTSNSEDSMRYERLTADCYNCRQNRETEDFETGFCGMLLFFITIELFVATLIVMGAFRHCTSGNPSPADCDYSSLTTEDIWGIFVYIASIVVLLILGIYGIVHRKRLFPQWARRIRNFFEVEDAHSELWEDDHDGSSFPLKSSDLDLEAQTVSVPNQPKP